MATSEESREWYRHGDGVYLCSTNPSYLQPAAINAALSSELLWWAKGLDEPSLTKMLNNCLCLGLYHIQAGSSGTVLLVSQTEHSL